ncbi:MAG: carboxypeptidase Taq [Verrucomicrobiota bacterium]|jgi:carboxypeptidase Taq
MPHDFAPYARLLARSHEIACVDAATALLTWDEETYMPRAALEFRAGQLAFFSGWSHRQFTALEVGDWIKACEDRAFGPESDEAANVRNWRWAYDRATKLPPELVEEFNRATTLARDAWAEARRRSEFALFQSHLETVLGLSRRMADHWGYSGCRYDALLEGHERGARAADLSKLFAELRPAIVEILAPAAERTRGMSETALDGDYPIAAQEAFNREVAEAIGFDFNAGRIDTTTHPFCTGVGARDCRLTTRYDPRNFVQSLYGVLHEAGHGLYDQGLPVKHYGTPLGRDVSMGIHESQSRLWENHVGRTREFWEHWHGPACRHLPALKKFSPEHISRAINRVAPSFIRVEADQVTYDLHIILRFEVEMQLIEGHLKPADLPAFWNEEFEKMLGLKVPDDARGCLQDTHWSIGAFGYFPTYTLGNLNAAQLMACAVREQPALPSALSAARYGELLGWLRQKIHVHGQRWLPPQLMERATGEPTAARHHLEYLRRKFVA